MEPAPRLPSPEDVISVSRLDDIVVKVVVKTIMGDVEFQIGADEALELRDQLDKAIWRDDLS